MHPPYIHAYIDFLPYNHYAHLAYKDPHQLFRHAITWNTLLPQRFRHAVASHTSLTYITTHNGMPCSHTPAASAIVSHLHMLAYVLRSVLTPCCSLPSCSLPSLPTLSLAHCVRSISHLVHAERVRRWGGKHLVARARRHLQGGEATVERSTLGRQVCNS